MEMYFIPIFNLDIFKIYEHFSGRLLALGVVKLIQIENY